jgi:hypothetical protein
MGRVASKEGHYTKKRPILHIMAHGAVVGGVEYVSEAVCESRNSNSFSCLGLRVRIGKAIIGTADESTTI